MRRSGRALVVLMLLASVRAAAQSPAPANRPRSPQEEKRRKLLEEIGLDKQSAPPPVSRTPAAGPAPAAAVPDRGTAAEEAPAAGAGGEKKAKPPAAPAAPSFRRAVHPALMAACGACHREGAPAGMTRLLLSGDAAADHAGVARLASPARPAESPLLAKASGGQPHGGGTPWPTDSASYARVLAWIARGARLDAPDVKEAATPAAPAAATATGRKRSTAPSPGAPVPPAPAQDAEADDDAGADAGDDTEIVEQPERPESPEAAPEPPVPGASAMGEAPSAPAPAPRARHGRGIDLPFGFLLNGRFDLDYERRDFSGQPFDGEGVNALRSYHHFLFLSRERADERCGLSVEVLALTFWQAHCRVFGSERPVALSVGGGKIVVPFGADPLYHQSYGGLAGFDQRLLPAVWAQEGVTAHAVYQRKEVVVTADLFVVRGHGLSRADGVLDLQSDFSPADAVHLGSGARVGASWRALSAWYSAYVNPLGFDRRLFMQAIDVAVYRWRAVPVLGHFSFGAGLLRADVSGGAASGVGGPGQDYYHFGSYLQVRYHPTDWLYVQYRQGLRTFDNRRGVILDNSRLTSADGSTHSFGAVARHHGLSAGVYHFINLEKADEIPDDLFRVSVIYEF